LEWYYPEVNSSRNIVLPRLIFGDSDIRSLRWKT